MSDFKDSRFFKFISSLLGQAPEDKWKYSESEEERFTAADSDASTNLPERLWKKNNEPLRQIVLWGWDENNNPGFLILYGTQHFKSKGAAGNLLQNEVKYTDYVIFKGKGGHLPSLQAVEIVRPYDYRSRTHGAPRMYYKRGAVNRWYGDNNNQYLVKEFKNIPPEQQVSFPYYIPLSQEQYVGKMVNRPQNFRLANSPNDILKLSGQLLDYYPTIVDMMSNQNIYMRKKRLKELIDKSCGKQVLKMLLEVGGTDIVSGLFLELAKQGNPILLGEAKAMLEGEMKWAEENYAEGIKRCIRIYINAVNPDLKADRKEWIYRYLSKMDLHLVRINQKDIPPDKVLEGADYRRYANSGQLQDYYWRYDYKTRTNSKYEASRRYEAGLYNDGVRLRLIDFKNTIQEAEVYGLADVVGRIGYYLDAPRITYYLKGSGKEKALRYFRRYIKRIINSYAEADPDKFIEAMKEFLTSYSKPDYTGKFSGNFQSNELLKYYIYHEYKEKPASGWQSYNWIDDDQLLKLKGRYEYRKDIWDNHLDAAAEIAVRAKIETVAKACYYILKDSPKSGEFIENAGYRQLINLSLVAYGPMSEMFMGILDNRIKKLDSFDSELMICLIGSGDERMYMTAMEFFHRTNGLFSPSDTADLLFLDNLSRWEELFRENLLSLEGEQYINFIIETIKKSSEGLKYKGELPEGITEILSKTTEKVGRLSDSDRAALIKELIAALLHGTRLPLWLQIFIEEVIFSTSHEALEALAKDIYIETAGVTVSARSRRVISMLDAIKARDIPADAQLIDILRSGTPKMINVLFGIITENSEKLMERFSTILIMLESEVSVLNEKAKECFDVMGSEDQKKLLALIIDSPVEKVYTFGLKKLGELYRDNIPEELIIQMLEHGSEEVKAFISDKVERIINNFGEGNEKLFMYYIKTLLLLPNRASRSKERIFEVLPGFVLKYTDNLEEVQGILLDLGGSNSIIDSERALVALAKIRGEVVLSEG